MFETLNAILGTDLLRYSLLMGSGALLAYTLHPLPSAIDTFASSSVLKFGTLFLFGLLMAHPLNMSKFMVVFFAALVIMILFEYFRQVDKGLSGAEATATAAKEFMWGDDPMNSYPGQIPYADPRMGVPQFLPDGVTPAVTFVGDAGGVSNTGNYTVPKRERFGPRDDALYQGLPLSYSASAPYGDKDFGIPGQMADGSPGLVFSRDSQERMANPFLPTFSEINNVTQKMASFTQSLKPEQMKNPFLPTYDEINGVTQRLVALTK